MHHTADSDQVRYLRGGPHAIEQSPPLVAIVSVGDRYGQLLEEPVMQSGAWTDRERCLVIIALYDVAP